MTYLSYIRDKLKVSETPTIIVKAVEYLGENYPNYITGKKGSEIVDEWIENVIKKWKVECKPMFLSQMNLLGKLEPKKNGFILNYNQLLENIPSQKRFVFAHELAHILSFNTDKNYPEYNIIHSHVEEYFCDRIAREILLPKSLINLSTVDLSNLNPEQVSFLKSVNSEYEIAIWQIVQKILGDVNSHDLISIYWKYKYGIDENKNDTSHLKIIDFYRPKGYFIPKNDRAFVQSPLREKKEIQSTKLPFLDEKINYVPRHAFKKKDFFQGYDLISIGSIYKKKLFTTAFYFETTKDAYVIQIINLNS